MQAIVIDPQSPQRVGFRSVEPPAPRAAEALIRVKAVSLNRGEVVYRVQGEAGTRLGWDLAGVVEQPATEGPGPARGARVVGLLPSGAWAEQAAVPASALAELEPSVTFAQAYGGPRSGTTQVDAAATILIGYAVLGFLAGYLATTLWYGKRLKAMFDR